MTMSREETRRELFRMQRLADETRTRLMEWLTDGGWPSIYAAVQHLERIRTLDEDPATGLPTFLFDAAYCGMVGMLADSGIQKLEEMDDEGSDEEEDRWA